MEIIKLFEDSKGNIWIGTYDGGTGAGIACFDGRQWTSYSTKNGLISNCVYSMFEDPDGKMWFGTTGGISVFDGGKWYTLQEKDGLIDNSVYSMAIVGGWLAAIPPGVL